MKSWLILLGALPTDLKESLLAPLSSSFYARNKTNLGWFWKRNKCRLSVTIALLNHLPVGRRAEAMGLSNCFSLHTSGMRFGTDHEKSIPSAYFCEEIAKATEISFADAQLIWKTFLDLIRTGAITFPYAERIEVTKNWIQVYLKVP